MFSRMIDELKALLVERRAALITDVVTGRKKVPRMSHEQILEYEFESTICSELGERGWLYQNEGDTRAAGWDLRLALIPGDVLHWLSTQYPDEYDKAIPADLTDGQRDKAERGLLTHLTKELSKATRVDTTGKPVGRLLGVLRTGFPYAKSAAPPPSSAP